MTRRGFFGIGIYHPKHACNVGTLWRSAFAFGASFIFTVGQRFARQASDTPNSWARLPMYRYADLEDLKQHLPYSCPLVGVELAEDARPLGRFCHPLRACYLLGAEDHGLPPSVIEQCHNIVQVDGLRVCLNVATAGTIVLYDRVVKAKSAPCSGGWMKCR